MSFSEVKLCKKCLPKKKIDSMNQDELAKFLDEIFDERQVSQPQSTPIFHRTVLDCLPQKLIARNEKRKQQFLQKYYDLQQQTRKLRESSPNSGNYS